MPKSRASLDSLSFDVIDYILSFEHISFINICRLACVCKMLNSISKSNTLWRKKYKQMWPDLAVLYDVPNTDWKNEFKKQFNYSKLVAQKLAELSSELYHTDHISDQAFFRFKDIVQHEKYGFEIIICELESTLNDVNRRFNLTHKYYAEKALKYLRHEQLKILWQELLSQPSSKISLVEGACLISQWFQTTNSQCTVNVSSQITGIANRVLELVKQNYPVHPVIKHGLTNEILTESLWTPPQCKHILLTINEVLYNEMDFSLTRSIDVDTLCYTYIDHVLDKKKGHSIIFGIIYAAVAGKLGVVCLPVHLSSYFLLKWLERPELAEDKERYTIIDVFGGALLEYRLSELQFFKPDDENFLTYVTAAVHPAQVFGWVVEILLRFFSDKNNAEAENDLTLFKLRDSFALICLLSPDDMEYKLSLARLYEHLGINTKEAISLMKEIAKDVSASDITRSSMYRSTLRSLKKMKIIHPPVKPNFRARDDKTDHVRFATGMVMRHIGLDFRCVIYGWDPECDVNSGWINGSNIKRLKLFHKQPFYRVLASDGTNKYVPEEYLKLDGKCLPIDHPQIGRYFESFHITYYSPNDYTRSEYPDEVITAISKKYIYMN